MIQVEGLSIGHQGIFLFDEVSFSIQPGEKCGLVGRNGSGKSTLIKLLTGQDTPDSGNMTFRKGYTIATLEQHIAFTQDSVLQEALCHLPLEAQSQSYKAEKILHGLGFTDEVMAKAPSLLSGGYQLRLHLAKALLSEPDCLLLDEPTNYLDIITIRWLTELLRNWKGEFILISHDREFIDSVTTHTMGIHRQKVRKVKGSTLNYYEQLCQEEEIHQRTVENLEKKRAHLQSFIDRFGAKATKAAQANARKKMLARIPSLERLKELYQLDFGFNEAPFPGNKMIEASHLSFSYQNNLPIIDDFSLTLERGERIAIIGKNGLGKSTLLKLLAKDLTPQAGSIKFSDNVKLGYFGQTNIDRLHNEHMIEEEISTANPLLTYSEVKAICGLMMFSGSLADKPISVLSGGERSRVLLGKILAAPCNILLLDEPTHHLDMESIEALIDALEDFQGALILVTHSELMLKRIVFDKLVICRQGKQELFLGDYEDFLEKKGWEGESILPSKRKGKDSREIKQQRADLIGQRSKALKPIDQKIASLEKQLHTLEAELQTEHRMLAAEIPLPQGASMQDVAKSASIRQRTIEEIYHQLEELLQQRETLENDYASQLDELS